MSPMKRTVQEKRTASTSPTASTSRASADHRRSHRHTSSMITRSSASADTSPKTLAHREPTPDILPAQKGSHEKPKKLVAEVAPPGARTPLAKFVYVLLFLVLILVAWYVYGMVILLEKLKEEVGWWGIIVGEPGWAAQSEIWSGWRTFGADRKAKEAEVGRDGELEASLNALANVLGISPLQVASAVRPVIPQESLTSIASKSKETRGSEAVRMLIGDTTDNTRMTEQLEE